MGERELRGESVGFLKPLLLIFIQKSVFYPAVFPFIPVSITALTVIGESRPLAHSMQGYIVSVIQALYPTTKAWPMTE